VLACLCWRVGLFALLDRLVDGLVAVRRAGPSLVPLVAVQARLAKQAGDCPGVLARPERQHGAKGKVGLALAGVAGRGARAHPELQELGAVLGPARLTDDLLATESGASELGLWRRGSGASQRFLVQPR